MRDGAAFCGGCGSRQPAPVETPEAVRRYREVVARFLGDGGLDGAKQGQLDELRVRLSVSLATHAALLAELEPESPPPPSIRLSIDVVTLAHFAVGARCLARFKVENDGPLALETLSLQARLSGEALPAVEAATLFPGRASVLPLIVTPEVAGFHELSGELRLVDLMGEGSRYTFSDIHVRVGGEGPKVQVLNIDQSAARVVDNSRSSFGGGSTGGLVSHGDWQPVPLVTAREQGGARRASNSTNARRVEFAV